MTALASDGLTRDRSRAVEWPSLILCAAVYLAFFGLLWVHDALPNAVVLAVGALLVTLQSSLQHEFIHGHPTPWRHVNRALASVPVSLWLPFELYRRSHLVHHCDEKLTDPLDDPESYYWSADQWRALGPAGRLIVQAHTTLAGRLLLGPGWNVGRFLRSELRALRAGDRQRGQIWTNHLFAVAILLIFVIGVLGVNPLLYLAIVYAGTAVLLLRSFAEHRANEGVFERTAIVENAWFFGPLFLFNNLHAAHHERPLMPWYQLPGWYRANRARLVTENGGLVYDGYADVARRYLFTPHHELLHPTKTGEQAGA